MNAFQCARYVYKTEGMRGFYRGLTASYAGISETMICFLIYETLKKHLAHSRFTTPTTDTEKRASDFLGLMMAAAFAKGCASCIAYPHGMYKRPSSDSLSKYTHAWLFCCNNADRLHHDNFMLIIMKDSLKMTRYYNPTISFYLMKVIIYSEPFQLFV